MLPLLRLHVLSFLPHKKNLNEGPFRNTNRRISGNLEDRNAESQSKLTFQEFGIQI